MDIIGHQDQIDSLSSQAQAFVTSGHFDFASIQERQLALVARYEGLQVCMYMNENKAIYITCRTN